MNTRVRTTSPALAPRSSKAARMISKQRRACTSGSGSQEPSGQIGAVPDTSTLSPTRTARLIPILPSYGEPDEARRRSAISGPPPLRQVLLHPLQRLGETVVRRRERDAEEALAAGPVHRAGRDHDGRLLEHELRERRRGVAFG